MAAPGLRPSPVKVRGVVEHFARTPSDFHLVAFEAGRVVGAIAACVTEMLFFERCEATVVMCQARGTPGVGRELIGRLRRVQFPIEIQARPGFERLLRGFGFHAVHKTAIYNKE